MSIPEDSSLSISKLASVFRNTSATYKFYWFWSILEMVEDGHYELKKEAIFARMVSLSWYTVNYFYVSFGSHDLLQKAVFELRDIENLKVDEKRNIIIQKLLDSENPSTQRILRHFDKNVPHKFLSPWMGSGSKKDVYFYSQLETNQGPYALFDDRVVVSKSWLPYLIRNMGILKTFCYWNLGQFLQNRNPNVPGIINKILRPVIRESLNRHKTKFWDLVIQNQNGLDCIYTGNRLVVGTYVVEHFLPHQYVAHNLMWNLIPADANFNSRKSDKLPPMELYFEKFFEIQKIGIDVIKTINPKNKFLEDYLPIFPDLNLDRVKYKELLSPMITIAHNNGFQYL